MFFITMKKVKRKTIKTCHSPDDEKNIKVAIPMLTKKYQFKIISSHKINFEQKKRTCFLKRRKKVT